ncbi:MULTISPECIES: glycine cleavage system protein GcvH [Pseudothermotoga]|jgi:glycine cleavage system H protein|uniref:Glycine cleavage system H protein n=1 Tax=Pseudothermotoga lettingae (strain ATCC BAA-301 / DSM 14385 / NBRC 107922 / TMO) TaxID=416591 RepID=A8F8M8_PSELT|nr:MULTISPECIES: glycine cleavage system protein GcvH [Pseudothermotoga]ABV34512.1 glycine cleavage system H protein [Pseudothermotoga lettingae TMO]KUK20773.1 MAG: Glycine cleavage system H protein [Pseudothermotoga lettingae]MDI3494580.1 glycine cleavage system protein [Pseudothermotoga sp.]MDK2883543.1 glycine cleavage system protein [Pseudothermotoga sp.]GLI48542.1 glycine cleavage system H protein [Pseudothermotoga lettingae TMO]
MKRYAKTHEWVSADGNIAIVGITNFAQEKLGDVVYVDLPQVGKVVKKGEMLMSIESVKAASDVYAPVSGKVTGVNEKLNNEPELVNKDPEGEGWLVKIEMSNVSELEELLDEEAYRKFCEEEG